ncbi:hypothetical protein ACHAQD_005168 [Fusarium lateritium]
MSNENRGQPIYVGEFWDILLQTQNCFSMLQYLRPQRGRRAVWIDAICINQGDLNERNEQVQMMGQIYSQCIQVLLWLGADLVRPVPGTHPYRRPLQNISLDTEISDVGKPTTLADILRRRYFSRVWVVQELILAPRVIMPVGNTIFFVHPRTEREFLESGGHGSNRASSQIPWMEYITQGRVIAHNLFEVVGLLATSQASDARDKVFGVLGLLPSHSGLESLRPDYSLSQKSAFTGFVAHSIFVEGNHFLLHQACGIAGLPDFPSWAPSYHHLATDWENFLNRSHIGHSKREYVQRLMRTTAFNMSGEEYRNLTKTHCGASQILAFRSVSIGYSEDHMQQHEKICGRDLHTRLESDTGRLGINLKRVLAIREAPVPIDLQSLQGCRIPLRTEGSLVNPGVYLIGFKDLHTIVRVGDEVWILETPGTLNVFLVLRKQRRSQKFSLVATCCYVYCVFYEPVARDQPSISENEVNHVADMCLSTLQMQVHMHREYGYIKKMLNMQSGMNSSTFLRLLRSTLRAPEGDGYELTRLPGRRESLPRRRKDICVSSFQSDVESWTDGDYHHVKMQQGSGSLLQFDSMGWEVVSQGEYITFRRKMLQDEEEYEMILSSPTYKECLEVCLSVCRRTYGNYALKDIDKLALQTTYGYEDVGKVDKNWDRWWDLPDELFSYNTSTNSYRFVNSDESDMGDLASGGFAPGGLTPDDLFRGFELDGSQYRVTIV